MTVKIKIVDNDTNEVATYWTITKKEKIMEIMSKGLSLPSHEINDFISGAKTKIIAKHDIEIANQTMILEFQRY